MISHKNATVVENRFEKLEVEFGKRSSLLVTQGKTHNYLGMDIDCSETGKVKLIMPHLIKEIIQQMPKDMKTANHLFQVSPKATPLSNEQTKCSTSGLHSYYICGREQDQTYKQLYHS
jgi:hypothetical protein